VWLKVHTFCSLLQLFFLVTTTHTLWKAAQAWASRFVAWSAAANFICQGLLLVLVWKR
jgi:hypothetical protein